MKRIIRSICLITICAIAFSAAAFSASAGSTKYIRGDADGNGNVEISDVTLIQRLLVGLETDPDGKITLRGDVNKNGLDMNDAKNIQRYIAMFSNVLGIGNSVTVGSGDYDLPFVSD